MPDKLPANTQIIIQKKSFSGKFSMTTMQMATDHYNICYVTSGDRRTITTTQTYDYHAGDVAMAPPFMLHRTVSLSDAPYNSYFIKFSPSFIQPFFDKIGHPIIDILYDLKICHFSETVQTKIESIFRNMYEENQKNHPYKEVILQGMLFYLFTTIWEEHLNDKNRFSNAPLTTPIINSLSIICNQYAQDISLEKIAKTVGLSAAYLSRSFHSQIGKSFMDYLTDYRLGRAKHLLANSDLTIMEIAMETGFCNGDYLSTQFRKRVGVTPTQFRKISKPV